MSNSRLMDAVIERTERATTVMRLHGLDTLELTQGWASPLRSAAPGPRGVGTVSDPTGTAACSDHDDREAHAYARLCDDLAELEIAAAKVTHALVRLKRLSPREARVLLKSVSGRRSTLAPCACLNCDDLAPVGSTHCDPCRRYLAEHPGVMQVPRYVILGRERERGRRTRRGVYVTGPFSTTSTTAATSVVVAEPIRLR